MANRFRRRRRRIESSDPRNVQDLALRPFRMRKLEERRGPGAHGRDARDAHATVRASGTACPRADKQWHLNLRPSAQSADIPLSTDYFRISTFCKHYVLLSAFVVRILCAASGTSLLPGRRGLKLMLRLNATLALPHARPFLVLEGASLMAADSLRSRRPVLGPDLEALAEAYGTACPRAARQWHLPCTLDSSQSLEDFQSPRFEQGLPFRGQDAITVFLRSSPVQQLLAGWRIIDVSVGIACNKRIGQG